VANAYAATSLIAALRRKGWIPTTGTSLSTADFLGFFNDEAAVYLTALLKSIREEYLVNEANYDVAFVSGTAQVRVPTRCVGAALRMVSVLDASGNPMQLTRVEPEGESLYSQAGSVSGFMLRGNVLQLMPTPNLAGTLRIKYLQRMSTIVDESACGLITAINTGTKVVTCGGGLPATLTTSTPLDFVQGVPPFDVLQLDAIPTATTSTTATFGGLSALPTGLLVGDYLALAGQTPIPQVPVECHKHLATRVAYVLGLATNSVRVDALKALMDEEAANLKTLLSARVTGNNRPILNPNGPGMRRWRAY
jgi:hypothetical protein